MRSWSRMSTWTTPVGSVCSWARTLRLRSTSTSAVRGIWPTRGASLRARRRSTASTWTGCGAPSCQCRTPTSGDWPAANGSRRSPGAQSKPSTLPGMRRTTSATSTVLRGSSSPATPLAFAQLIATTCCPRRLHPTSTSRPGRRASNAWLPSVRHGSSSLTSGFSIRPPNGFSNSASGYFSSPAPSAIRSRRESPTPSGFAASALSLAKTCAAT